MGFQNLINLLFPKVCMGCDSFLLTNENVICTSCRHEIPLTQHSRNSKNEAFMKFYGRIPLEYANCFMFYHKKGIVQEIIHNLKYRGHEEIGTIFGDWFASDIDFHLHKFDAIIPVPLHPKRMRSRGYNQVTTFGMSLSKSFSIEYNPTILHRNINSKTQVKKNFFDRTALSDSLFGVNFDEKDHHKHYLLIDDVLTTGSTLEACCNALLKIPGTKISIVCLAMSHS